MIGKELAHDRTLPLPVRLYIRAFGIPISGLRNRARRVLPLVTGDYRRVLDAGCGQGAITFELARRLPASVVTGVDLDRALVDRNRQLARRCGLKNCTFECLDITRALPDDRFDLILSLDFLEHVQDDDTVLRALHASLASGGELIVHVPGYHRRWFLLGWEVNFEVEGHCRPGYERDDIVDKVEKAGFEVAESFYTYGWLETVTNNVSYLITRARMERKALYSMVFPALLCISYLGRNSRPKRGAGVLVRARKR